LTQCKILLNILQLTLSGGQTHELPWEFGNTIFSLLKHSVSLLIFQDRSSPTLWCMK